jgi:hypothetical protein
MEERCHATTAHLRTWNSLSRFYDNIIRVILLCIVDCVTAASRGTRHSSFSMPTIIKPTRHSVRSHARCLHCLILSSYLSYSAPNFLLCTHINEKYSLLLQTTDSVADINTVDSRFKTYFRETVRKVLQQDVAAASSISVF